MKLNPKMIEEPAAPVDMDEFDKYFDVEAEPAVEPVEGEPIPVEGELQPVDQSAAIPPTVQPVAEPAVPATMLSPTPVAGEAEYLAEIERLKAQLAQTQQPAPSAIAEPAPSAPAEPAMSLEEFFKDDPDVSELYRDYPEIAKAQEKMLTVALTKVVDLFAQEIQKRDASLGELLTPILSNFNESKKTNHISAIKQAHPDADEIIKSGALQQWIQQQPAYLQEPLNKVYSEGSADDVISLLNQFKQTTQPTAPPAPKQAAMPQTPPKPEMSPEDLEKLKMMAGMDKKRVSEPRTSKAVDFDAAFEEAIRGLT